jgi:hypothetical protein
MRLHEHQVQIGQGELSSVRRSKPDHLIGCGDQPEGSEPLISRGLSPQENESSRAIDEGLLNGLDPAQFLGSGTPRSQCVDNELKVGGNDVHKPKYESPRVRWRLSIHEG